MHDDCEIALMEVNSGVVALREAYPDKPIIIFADDDRHLPLQDPPLTNAGREYGQASCRGGERHHRVSALG